MFAIDIDGVIAASEGYLVRELEFFTGQKYIPPVPRTYDFRDGFRGLSLKDCLKNIDVAIQRYSNVIPVHNYRRTYLALAKIYEQYGIVHLITARNDDVWFETDEWLTKYFGAINFNLHAIGHLGDKELLMFKYDLNVLVDDRLKNVNEMNNPRNSAYLVNRPWNAGRDIRGHVIRVDDLLEAVNHHLGEPDV